MNNIKQRYTDPQVDARRYVFGQMSEDEAQAFEAYFLAKPDVLDIVEATQEMHFGLIANEQMQAETETTNSAEVQPSESAIAKLLGWLAVPVPAFAVLAMAAVLSPFALNGLSSNTQLDNEIVLMNFSTMATRSTDKRHAEIDLSQANGQSAVLVKVKSVEHKDYKLKLVSIDALKPVWVSELFQMSALRDALVTIPKLKNVGISKLELVGINPDQTETAVRFCHYSESCN